MSSVGKFLFGMILAFAVAQRCAVHFYRNVFSHVPNVKVAKVARMLKAIHAIASTKWGKRRCMSMDSLLNPAKKEEAA